MPGARSAADDDMVWPATEADAISSRRRGQRGAEYRADLGRPQLFQSTEESLGILIAIGAMVDGEQQHTARRPSASYAALFPGIRVTLARARA